MDEEIILDSKTINYLIPHWGDYLKKLAVYCKEHRLYLEDLILANEVQK